MSVRTSEGMIVERFGTTNTIRKMPLKTRSAQLVARCAQGAWLLLAATPVIVVICAING